MASVEITLDGHVATIVLNRPDSMNAVDPAMRVELHAAWDRIRTDPQIRVAVVTGAGEKAFCVGSDLKRTMPTSDTPAQQVYGDVRGAGSLIANLRTDKPMIAAINGYAMGGGMELALACDIRICSENAQFALSEVRVGSMPGAGGTVRLPRYIGRSDAMMMLLTGERVDAAEALRVGLVSRVHAQAELSEAAQALAQQIAGNAPLSVRAVKRMVLQGQDMPLDAAMDAERNAFGLLYNSEDRIEGRKAFAEKRTPQFSGR
ncbi:enoyl-CoA hydratase/isomerase family protein [Verticiella sediminum]|uniref:Enoyl-CoA hydratase/isomerase family protein n=1 Tax=Verticiella sediminum TaxID=1247510 RepID=A0A556B1B5_9BURK|nr:enoyl-CoA hydratase-related protein [Verticiella sediminum]TSH98988.1 enoyl-CoA hydratase/isomerase family protein [Verticiella sediminum]